MKKKLYLLLPLLVAFGATACISLTYGVPPNVDSLSSLTVGDSSKADVLLALGEPRGYGQTSSYRDLDPREIWFYEYIKGGTSTARFEMLVVFLFDDKYDGYLWFSSFEDYQTEGGTAVVAKPTALRSKSEFAPVNQIDDKLVRGNSTETDVLALLGLPTGSGRATIPPNYDPQDVLYYEDIEISDMTNAPGGVIELAMEQRILLVFLQEGVFDGFMWYFFAHRAEAKSQ
jgi:hypothetical protein